MFESIGDEVVQYLLHLLGVEPYPDVVLGLDEIEIDFPGIGIFLEQQECLIGKFDEVVLARPYLHVSVFEFAEIQKFRDQILHLGAAAIDRQYLVVDFRRNVFHCEEHLGIPGYEGQRRTEFMRDIREKPNFGLVQGLDIFRP